jgi:hypothetical protein
MMPYFPFIVVILIAVCYYWEKNKQLDLKRHGVRVPGLIIGNSESNANSDYRLGGNINNPMVKFVTETGYEITGEPIIGFISGTEVIVPSPVYVFYDKKNPKRFCLDTD